MLLERLPEVQSLSVEDKWRLIDELWSDLAQEIERAGVDDNTLALLNQRFEEYIQDPGQAQPLDACLARPTERKRRKPNRGTNSASEFGLSK
jgi:putative addiction module component (TIGR02574 family)